MQFAVDGTSPSSSGAYAINKLTSRKKLQVTVIITKFLPDRQRRPGHHRHADEAADQPNGPERLAVPSFAVARRAGRAAGPGRAAAVVGPGEAVQAGMNCIKIVLPEN